MSFQALLWFRRTAFQLRLAENPQPPVPELRRHINYHLASRVEHAFERGIDVADPLVLCDLALMDLVLRLEDRTGELVRVAVRVTTDERRAWQALVRLRTQELAAVREALGIDKHWVVLVSDKEPVNSDLAVEILYAQADVAAGCALVDLRP